MLHFQFEPSWGYNILLGGVWLGGENVGEQINLNSLFISIVWFDKMYKNLISIRI